MYRLFVQPFGLYRLYYRYRWFVQSMVYTGCTDMDDLSSPWFIWVVLQIWMICPIHGTVLSSSTTYYITLYIYPWHTTSPLSLGILHILYSWHTTGHLSHVCYKCLFCCKLDSLVYYMFCIPMHIAYSWSSDILYVLYP